MQLVYILQPIGQQVYLFEGWILQTGQNLWIH